jgi:aminoglycoside phosphotransferase (APT) family kinase protein
MELAGALDLLAASGGPVLRLVGRLPGGETGAYELRDADGVRLVAKLMAVSWAPRLDGLEARTAALRARGYPVRRHVVHRVGNRLLVVQEHVAGAASDDVPEALVDRLVELNELQAGLGDEGGEPWGADLRRTLTEGADGYCLHAPLRDHSPRAATLLERIEDIGERLAPDAVPDGDAVHTDFHHRNVLRRDGEVRAIIDWEGSRGGDRLFDLVTLAFTLPAARSPAGAAARVWRRVEAAGARPVIEAYVAHMALRQVDWSIRHHGPGEVGLWLDTAEEALARYG